MARLSYQDQQKTHVGTVIDREVQRYFSEKDGDAAKFQKRVADWKRMIGTRNYWGGVKID